mmetsp:Transcript_6791/g.14865  ORF Transcript_6791/g.14865 Transcript_6791/m.14865 type:complete len:197 (-) Transcript_6791:500-1090(-)
MMLVPSIAASSAFVPSIAVLALAPSLRPRPHAMLNSQPQRTSAVSTLNRVRLCTSGPSAEPLLPVSVDPQLAVGDAVALLIFAAIGRSSHSAEDGSIFTTAAPFFASWGVLAPVLGAYRSSASLSRALLVPLPALAIAVPCGCAVRGLLQDRMPAMPFWVVSLIAIGVLISSWRAVHFSFTNAIDSFVDAIVDEDD